MFVRYQAIALKTRWWSMSDMAILRQLRRSIELAWASFTRKYAPVEPIDYTAGRSQYPPA
jgi:hypothetical protein